MNCEEFRRQLMRDPETLTDEMAARVEECEVCRSLAEQVMTMDPILREAMAVEVPANLGQTVMMQRILERRRRGRAPLFALAATVLLGVGVASGIWLGGGASQANVMAQHLVEHIEHEADLLQPSDVTVSLQRVSNVLQQADVRMQRDVGRIRHAGLCEFRGNQVPHLVVHTDTGPVTVMLLSKESVDAPESFEYGGYRGVIVPNGTGSIAIIGGDTGSIEPVRQRFEDAIEYDI
ncbi:MAG: DUF3379 family protein [Pseudomonadota bacterium]